MFDQGLTQEHITPDIVSFEYRRRCFILKELSYSLMSSLSKIISVTKIIFILDLNNVYLSAPILNFINLGFDPSQYFATDARCDTINDIQIDSLCIESNIGIDLLFIEYNISLDKPLNNCP